MNSTTSSSPAHPARTWSCSPDTLAKGGAPGGNESDQDVTPKGQTHRGYAGGALDTVPFVQPHERMSDWLANRIAGVLADEYKAGRSIRELAVDTGYSIARVRSLLERADVDKRQRGRVPRSVLERA